MVMQETWLQIHFPRCFFPSCFGERARCAIHSTCCTHQEDIYKSDIIKGNGLISPISHILMPAAKPSPFLLPGYDIIPDAARSNTVEQHQAMSRSGPFWNLSLKTIAGQIRLFLIYFKKLIRLIWFHAC